MVLYTVNLKYSSQLNYSAFVLSQGCNPWI